MSIPNFLGRVGLGPLDIRLGRVRSRKFGPMYTMRWTATTRPDMTSGRSTTHAGGVRKLKRPVWRLHVHSRQEDGSIFSHTQRWFVCRCISVFHMPCTLLVPEDCRLRNHRMSRNERVIYWLQQFDRQGVGNSTVASTTV